MVIQGYDRINWEDLPSQNTPINAENLNHMEDGIENLYAAIGDIDLDAIAADIAEVKEEVENFQPGVELTQEEYDDLTEEEKNNGTIYYIKDGDASAIAASDAHYDNSTSGLTATNVQGAVDEVQGEIDELNSKRAWKWHKSETGTTAISLSGLDIEDLFIKVDIGSGGNMTSMSVPMTALGASGEYFRLGGYQASNNSQLTIVQVSKSEVSLNSNYINGTNATASSIISVYYR